MLNQLKPKAAQRGFTLVEVIVVAVIVAILAAVAIPLYNGYVTTSRQNVVNNAAGSLASFCAASRNSGTAPAPIGSDVGSGTNITGANSTSWRVPLNVTAHLTGNLANGGTAQITHDDDNAIVATYNW